MVNPVPFKTASDTITGERLPIWSEDISSRLDTLEAFREEMINVQERLLALEKALYGASYHVP